MVAAHSPNVVTVALDPRSKPWRVIWFRRRVLFRGRVHLGLAPAGIGECRNFQLTA
jgi:hypothetical protein